jgi:hypothetical protein
MTNQKRASTGYLRLAAMLLLGTTFATAAHAETLTVTDVAFGDGALYQATIPTVEVVDGNLTEAEIRDLFQLETVDDLTRWAKITAKSVNIPEITVTYTLPTGATETSTIDETVTYRGITLADVVDGVAANTTIAGADVVANAEGADGGVINMTFGEMTSAAFDIGGMLGLYGIGGAAATDGTMKQIYADFTFAGGSFTATGSGKPEFKCDFGPAAAGKFMARPLKTSLTELAEVITRLEEQQKADSSATPAPADIKKLVGFYTDLLTAFATDPMHMDGFDCSGIDPTTNSPVKITTAGIEVKGFEPAIYPDFSLKGFNFEGADAKVGFGDFTWKKMDLHGPIDVLNAAETLDEAWFTANWRKLIPSMDGLSFSDVTFDIPGEGGGPRTKGSAGLFDITLGKYINGLPSEIAVALDDATFPLPPELAAGPAAPALAARGVTEITSDTHVKLHWDEASNTIIVDELLSDADEFFRIAIKGTIGNATPALFGNDENAALAASMGLTVKELTVDIEDRGFYGLVLAISSAEGGQPMQATRTALSGMVQGMTLAILGSSETSLAAVGELGKFLSGANSKVSITLTAKDGAGLSLGDLAALEKDPTVLAGKVDVTAVASGDPVPVAESAPAPAAPTDSTMSLEDQKRDLKTAPQQ